MAKKSGAGRAKITIDWKVVEKYLVAGCTGEQVAAALGIHADTLYNRCQEVKKKTFSDYSAEKRQKGNTLLHAKQFQSALGGNITMQIWLGKQRLGQEENPNKKLPGFDEKVGRVFDFLLNVSDERSFGRALPKKEEKDG